MSNFLRCGLVSTILFSIVTPDSGTVLCIVVISFLYVCMVNTIYLFSFVETPRKFIYLDPSLRIESSSIINLRGSSTKLNKNIVLLLYLLTTMRAAKHCSILLYSWLKMLCP